DRGGRGSLRREAVRRRRDRLGLIPAGTGRGRCRDDERETARWTVRRPAHAGAAQRAIAVFLDEVDDLVDPARLRWYRSAAQLKFASYLARRRPEGWAVRAASLIGEAAMAWA